METSAKSRSPQLQAQAGMRIDTSPNTLANRRPSIASLLNPDTKHLSKIDDTHQHYDEQSMIEQDGLNPNAPQNWRRYSAPDLSDATNNLTIIDYYGNQSRTSPGESTVVSQSTPTSPTTNNPVTSSSANSSTLNSPTKQNSMISPPQTPSVKSPSRKNFQFPTNNTDLQVHSVPPKVKRKRITPEQLTDLVAMFETTDTPSYEIREKLAKKLNMTNREVQVWFQNRRAKTNRAKANEHHASHQHHRFLHHHSVTPAQAASGHASVNNSHGNFTFVPMFANGLPSGGLQKARGIRRHSYQASAASSKKSSQGVNNPRPRATTVSHVPVSTQPSFSTMTSSLLPPENHQRSMALPPPIKTSPSYQLPPPIPHQYQSHSSSPTDPSSPSGPLTPTSPRFQSPNPPPYSLPPISSLNHMALTPPPPPQYPHIPAFHMHAPPKVVITAQPDINARVPESAIDLLATAAEYVQSEEKEKQRIQSLEGENNIHESGTWRPWLT